MVSNQVFVLLLLAEDSAVDRVGMIYQPPSTFHQNIQIKQKSATPKTKPSRGGKQTHRATIASQYVIVGFTRLPSMLTCPP